jgi:hypothetical protein
LVVFCCVQPFAVLGQLLPERLAAFKPNEVNRFLIRRYRLAKVFVRGQPFFKSSPLRNGEFVAEVSLNQV